MNWFIGSAKRYQLTGRPLEELCEHNATVALNLRRHQVSSRGTTENNCMADFGLFEFVCYIILSFEMECANGIQ